MVIFNLLLFLVFLFLFALDSNASEVSISCDSSSDVRLEVSYQSASDISFATDLDGSKLYPGTNYPTSSDYGHAVMSSTCQGNIAKIIIPAGVLYSVAVLGSASMFYYSALMGLAGISCGYLIVKGILDAYLN